MKKMFAKITAGILSVAMLCGIGFVSAKLAKENAAQVKAVADEVEISSFSAVSDNLNDYVSYEASKGGASTAPAINNGQIRVYQNGGLFKVSAKNGATLTNIVLGSSMATTVTYSVDGGSASSNKSITANGNLTVSGVAVEDNILFTCKGTSSSTRLYVNYLKVTYSIGESTTYVSSIIVNADKTDISSGYIGDTVDLSATVNYESGSTGNGTYTWNDPVFSGVGSFDKNTQTLTMNSASGSMTITATADDKDSNGNSVTSLPFIVNWSSLVTKVYYSPLKNASSLNAGDKFVLAATNAGKTEGFISALPSSSGKYLDKANAEYNAVDGSFAFASCSEITLGGTKDAWTLTINGSEISAKAEKELSFSGSGVSTWTISIDSTSGEATITSTNSSYGSIQYNPSNPRFCNYVSTQNPVYLLRTYAAPAAETKHVESISFTQSNCEIVEKLSYNTSLAFVPSDATNKEVMYVSNDNDVATVNDSGVITAVHAGTTTVTAVSLDNEDAEATISVTVVAPALDTIQTVYTETLAGERDKVYHFRGTITQVFFKTLVVQQGNYGITVYKNDATWTNGFDVYDVVDVTSKTTMFNGLVETTNDAVVELYEQGTGSFTSKTLNSIEELNSSNQSIAVDVSGLVYRQTKTAFVQDKTHGIYIFTWGDQEVNIKVQSSTVNGASIFNESLKYGTVMDFTDITVTTYYDKNGVGGNQLSVSDLLNVETSDDAIDFAELFLLDDCSTNLSSWDVLSDMYDGLSNGEKDALKYATYDPASYDTNSAVQQCAQRYDLVMSMYPGVYDNFMGRTAPAASSPVIRSLMDDASGVTTIVTVTAIASITLVGGFTLTRKRKHF